jgi:5'-phosphate synthase pdxT subunit
VRKGRRQDVKIGVLALQGDVREHMASLVAAGAEAVEVRSPQAVQGLDGLVMPGGESTTLGKLLAKTALDQAIAAFAREGKAIFGTCAGLILMAHDVNGSGQPRLGLMDLRVDRNAYGRQINSFEADLDIPALGKQAFTCVFIRAPQIASVGSGVEVLAEFEGRPILVRQGRLLAAAFHPELTDDLRVHRYFLSLVAGERLP